jgi:hypothetical protein
MAKSWPFVSQPAKADFEFASLNNYCIADRKSFWLWTEDQATRRVMMVLLAMLARSLIVLLLFQ